MNNEFKSKNFKGTTVYTLESATSGGTSAGGVASVSGGIGGVQRRRPGQNLIAQEGDKAKVPATKPRNFVAKNATTGGAGAHKDKKKAAKQGDVKHKARELDMAEEASPMIKPPTNRFDNKHEAFAYAREHGGKVFKSTYIDPNTGNKNINFVVKKEQGVNEKMMPSNMFAGSKKNKLGSAGQWKNTGPSKNRPARQGDLVGGAEESYDGGSYAINKPDYSGEANYTAQPNWRGQNIGENWVEDKADALARLIESQLK